MKKGFHIEQVAFCQVESGFEPELFKTAFTEWKNFTSHDATVDDMDEEEDSDSGNEAFAHLEIRSPGQRLSLKKAADIKLVSVVPEDYW